MGAIQLYTESESSSIVDVQLDTFVEQVPKQVIYNFIMHLCVLKNQTNKITLHV